MGLFDGVFKSVGQIDEERAELLKYQQALANEEIAQRRITAAQQQQVYGGSISGAIGSTQQAYNQAMQQKVMNQAYKPEPRFDPNTSEAFQIPLSQAVTMWQVKHGDKWYDAHQPRQTKGSDFYTDVFDRIQKAELFENVDGWYRLKENVETLLANH
jgi:hypothetical protein